MFGIMERSLEIAVAYTSEREAFGAPIGSFQALQHRCADMLIQTESTRSATFRATGSPSEFNIRPRLGRCARSQLECPIPRLLLRFPLRGECRYHSIHQRS
jgi:alkylation response protein AidB-like acyl-CoA dehydrogenase